MSDHSGSVYTSVPFKFIIDGEPLYIYSDLVSLHSKPLDRMIHGPMAEAQKGFATLEDVDRGTFVRFIEWAHKGYYTAADFTTSEIDSPPTSERQDHDGVVPTPAPLPTTQADFGSEAEPEAEPEPLAAPDPSQDVYSWQHSHSRKVKKGKKVTSSSWGNPEVTDDWENGFQPSRKDTAQKTKGGLKEAFISRQYTVRRGVFEIPPPHPNQNPREDYTDVFLSHAQLYVFADKYDIQPLKLLALEELHATLAIYTLYAKRTGDIIALLRYVYGNTSEPREGVEDIRTLMTQYVGYEMDMLIEDPEFKGLMIADRGDLLGDFLRMVAKRT